MYSFRAHHPKICPVLQTKNDSFRRCPFWYCAKTMCWQRSNIVRINLRQFVQVANCWIHNCGVTCTKTIPFRLYSHSLITQSCPMPFRPFPTTDSIIFLVCRMRLEQCLTNWTCAFHIVLVSGFPASLSSHHSSRMSSFTLLRSTYCKSRFPNFDFGRPTC